ncbi:SDR family NAD(P)-dependent oxidoreductase [Nocardia cyriacigeorgica]|uniref:SDR family NAD(P)-dependent oxidoreductase n=1 Tax=Nocardia cyriacigeorgica TaxID=135487 RepID=UPI0014861D2D|nr:SDR family NAD(P)-dependent oxidoreductase [Nocardia cyriacigeorgica]
MHPELAMVTCAGSGIGRDVAKSLAARGVEIVIADINLDAAQDAAAEIRRRGGITTAYRLDVAGVTALEEFADRVKSVHEVPDAVVNSAGIVVGEPPGDGNPHAARLHQQHERTVKSA